MRPRKSLYFTSGCDNFRICDVTNGLFFTFFSFFLNDLSIPSVDMSNIFGDAAAVENAAASPPAERSRLIYDRGGLHNLAAREYKEVNRGGVAGDHNVTSRKKTGRVADALTPPHNPCANRLHA
ncbi:unnamed protein product [Merluccius merluccius]